MAQSLLLGHWQSTKTLARLQDFCDRQNLFFMREIRLEHLSAWREEWSKYYSSKFALRNNQSRVRHFFRYASNAGMISQNPAVKLSTIKVTDEDFVVDPFTEKQYVKIIKGIGSCQQISARESHPGESSDATATLVRFISGGRSLP